jgi:hypothetical protein
MEMTQLRTRPLGTTGLNITRVGAGNLDLGDDGVATTEGRA